MPPLTSLDDLLVRGLQNIYRAEVESLAALPRMVRAATNLDLKHALEDHRQQTAGQIQRLEQVFMLLGVPTKGRKCEAMAGALEEAEQVMEMDVDSSVRDVALIGAAQKIEHYEIAAYGCVCTYAEALGYDQVHELLGQNLDEEETSDQKLTALAEYIIGQAADTLALVEPLERQA